MKKTFLALTLLLTAGAAWAQARGTWLATKYNFGAFTEESGPATCRFALVNTGLEPLAVVQAHASCGCTRPVIPSKPIAPGDTAYIEVSYDPQGRPGRFSKDITVETNGEPRKTRLTISGVVIGSGETVARRYPADLGPLKLAHDGIMLGEVNKGRLKTVYVDGYNRSSDSLRVKITRSPAWLDIVPAPEAAPPGEQVTLIAYVNADKCPLYGLVEDSVTISPAPGLEYTLPMTLLVKEDFSGLSASRMQNAPIAVPETQTIDYGTVVRDGGIITRTMTLANAGKDRLDVRRVYSTDPGVTVRIKDTSVKKGKKTVITVTVDPSVQTGALLNSRLNIITNDPMHPTYVIRLVGTYAE
ncbi:MAG: DUF1573 domain-containing protein [Bacteroidales bacterium]|nr:DUF1573 domain-containing protein [Bacteroidales bacterium]